MGIMLYRDGETHKIRGEMCEMRVFPTDQLDSRMAEGWRVSPAAPPPPEPEPVPEWVEAPRPTRVDMSGADNATIRHTAKLCGIALWKTARIATLKEMICNADTKERHHK